jgi:hypothetical protein
VQIGGVRRQRGLALFQNAFEDELFLDAFDEAQR